ncbi:hypothetical protein BATDEDRAFT_23143 [Batrachochytrium dendrobatidis JAM81]|uniref:GPN-loop GTPase 2 n=2 Tax=Batrachochytrium dendrobatidis TaxID=109871 RepID=F4NWV1_BATDJ|nr:uncharacterized protein BATDEDRAFT_23143 [Batrachochytrium dendrobatidis JAM81]EGF82884.1 hypothetical protein BATDEDRAFT_23143 [Batrachochytrium dendrobatidis JAM81]KAJ8327895.1 hypothetical protein O5D80_003287 [Batrachochytrium dendrobatidis]KAK5667159.1 hypothetical protein QVD99_006369 [Batrachochytrium dendrobatidis]OAJ39403.1 hypothetical protein BDEG_23254 [Batrachochytrium dendrobatidis JEL423]|eukprot:XP_006676712.1 hypothetical protein BATDEDRAFT_23143 [Batrachochytrium dendrobatidis JAM81]
MPFGQIVVGPPGCGKTTYCYGISQFYKATERSVAIVNLDPANDGLPYKADIDISELVTLDDAMETYGLGPNGGMIYCMEYLEANMDWLIEKLQPIKDKYILFDCPGQVELYTHHQSVKRILDRLSKDMDFRLCAVHLVDSHHCVDPSKYVAMLLLSLKTMIQLELPHVNVLSKIDLIESYGKLAFGLDFYTQVQDLSYLSDWLNADPLLKRYGKLNESLCGLVEDFGLVGFTTLCIEDKESVLHLAQSIDKANGYIYGGLEKSNESIFMTAERFDAWDQYSRNIAERYMMSTDGDGDDNHNADGLLGDIREHE